jgi:hypothetical protein
MSTVLPQTQPTAPPVPMALPPAPLRVYSHSSLYYWWPVWMVGFLFSLLTYMQGRPVNFGDGEGSIDVLVHPSRNLGVVFTMIFLLVIVMTNLAVRGIASMTVIVTLIAITIFFAWMDWWDPILRALGSLAIYMNLGFYLFFSTALFTLWAVTLLVFDRFEYWEFRPGQVVHHALFGDGEQTYDTHGMSVAKLRDDLFRHWILGLGSGDMHISTTGARKAEFVIPNVLFVGTKLERIQHLAAMKPNQGPDMAGQA